MCAKQEVERTGSLFDTDQITFDTDLAIIIVSNQFIELVRSGQPI